jgi:hypothetical protein
MSDERQRLQAINDLASARLRNLTRDAYAEMGHVRHDLTEIARLSDLSEPSNGLVCSPPALAAPPAGPEVKPEPPDEHEGTTLINELMMSGDLWARMANEAIPGATPELDRRFYEERMRRATMIRRRAEHVRAILGAVNETAALSFAKRESVEEARLLNRLCGPLAPAGTGGRR